MKKNETAGKVVKDFTAANNNNNSGVLPTPISSVFKTPVSNSPYSLEANPYETLRTRLYEAYNANDVYSGVYAEDPTEKMVFGDSMDNIGIYAYAWFKKPYRGRRSFGGMRISVGEHGKGGWRLFSTITEAMDYFITLHHYTCCA